MGEVCDSMRALAGKLNYSGMDCSPSKSTAGDALRDRDNELFKLYYFALIEYFKPLLSVSRKEKVSFENSYAFDSTTITLFSDVMKVIMALSKSKKAFSTVGALIRIHLISHLDLTWVVKKSRRAYVKRIKNKNKSPCSVQLTYF